MATMKFDSNRRHWRGRLFVCGYGCCAYGWCRQLAQPIAAVTSTWLQARRHLLASLESTNPTGTQSISSPTYKPRSTNGDR